MNAPPRWASNLASKAQEQSHGKMKVFPTPEYSSKQSSDPVVPLVPCTGIFLGPSKSGKTVTLIILEQYRGVFEKIYIFSPSVNIDDGWIPVKKYIEQDLGVNTEQEQANWEDWDEAALRGIIQRQRKITETSKKFEMKKLYQALIILDDLAEDSTLGKRRCPDPKRACCATGAGLRRACAPDVLRGPRGLQHAPPTVHIAQPARQTVAASSCYVAVGRCGYVPPKAEAHAPRAGQRQVPRCPRHAERPSQAGRPLPHLEAPNSARQHDPSDNEGTEAEAAASLRGPCPGQGRAKGRTQGQGQGRAKAPHRLVRAGRDQAGQLQPLPPSPLQESWGPLRFVDSMNVFPTHEPGQHDRRPQGKSAENGELRKVCFSRPASNVLPGPPNSLVFRRKPAPGVCSAPKSVFYPEKPACQDTPQSPPQCLTRQPEPECSSTLQQVAVLRCSARLILFFSTCRLRPASVGRLETYP